MFATLRLEHTAIGCQGFMLYEYCKTLIKTFLFEQVLTFVQLNIFKKSVWYRFTYYHWEIYNAVF